MKGNHRHHQELSPGVFCTIANPDAPSALYFMPELDLSDPDNIWFSVCLVHHEISLATSSDIMFSIDDVPHVVQIDVSARGLSNLANVSFHSTAPPLSEARRDFTPLTDRTDPRWDFKSSEVSRLHATCAPQIRDLFND